MAKVNRWLLPEGVEEILPRQAWQIEQFRRRVLDLYRSWGYELVIPPMIEYSESLLIGMGSDMDLQSFKLVDQMSGRTLAIRADITPQTARIDAHSWKQDGPTRLCYTGTVLHTKPKSQLASRTPIEVGAELFGDADVHSDCEIISLMLATIDAAGVDKVHLDLGHVGIYRELVRDAGLDEAAQAQLFDAFDRKAQTEVDVICAAADNAAAANMIKALIKLNGDAGVIAEARTVLADAPAAVTEAFDTLQFIVDYLQASHPHTPIYIDLAELRGYQYHTGLVYAAYIDGVGHSVANGGRYDGIGRLFGRERPATGFSANVNALLPQIATGDLAGLILAPSLDQVDEELLTTVAALRERGERVVHASSDASKPANCNQALVKENGSWHIKAL
ncbi:ATP phosphoribosyltransferase regulatory subunit [BD1-7 clade bacterium]|uniref:ATP phosphoribosyltransferase regulatory subunit n=1 Tax=BD1-7 clade bacterium TaxID=2029982 RepID=A0A5S9MYV1_9GAMM|nr:ATP phosphoribosyltransferase regulatory subunit [BD1-7 clade bacterium]CAA0082504.1 ATP phosphoribosyltransferase regulatory subunit [BD1-7 clade bacterium]